MIKHAVFIIIQLLTSLLSGLNAVMNIIPATNVMKKLQVMQQQHGQRRNGTPRPFFAATVNMKSQLENISIQIIIARIVKPLSIRAAVTTIICILKCKGICMTCIKL